MWKYHWRFNFMWCDVHSANQPSADKTTMPLYSLLVGNTWDVHIMVKINQNGSSLIVVNEYVSKYNFCGHKKMYYLFIEKPEPQFNIKMQCYQYRKPHCGDKMVLWPSHFHNGISYTGKMASLFWLRACHLQSKPGIYLLNKHKMIQPQLQKALWLFHKSYITDFTKCHWLLSTNTSNLSSINLQYKNHVSASPVIRSHSSKSNDVSWQL